MPNQKTRRRRRAAIEKKADEEWPLFDKWFRVVARGEGVAFRTPVLFRALFTPNLFKQLDQDALQIGHKDFLKNISNEEKTEFLHKYCFDQDALIKTQ